MNREEQYKKMLDEDNTMLVEDNEILRNKLTEICNFVDKYMISTTLEMKKLTNVSIDYFIGQSNILRQLKKMF